MSLLEHKQNFPAAHPLLFQLGMVVLFRCPFSGYICVVSKKVTGVTLKMDETLPGIVCLLTAYELLSISRRKVVGIYPVFWNSEMFTVDVTSVVHK